MSYSGHVLMENRNGLVADVEVLQANGTAERDAGLVMIEAIPVDHTVTVGADKNYDTKDFVAESRNLNATPHVSLPTLRIICLIGLALFVTRNVRAARPTEPIVHRIELIRKE